MIARGARRRRRRARAASRYVETHGTATPLGRPDRGRGADAGLPRGDHGPRASARIGSVKSNVGHLVIAAGRDRSDQDGAGAQARVHPADACTSRRPTRDRLRARARSSCMRTLEPWPRGPTPRRAGVSAFGVGGTNAHVVLEEAAASRAARPARGRRSSSSCRRARPAALDAGARRGSRPPRGAPRTLDLADVALHAAGRPAAPSPTGAPWCAPASDDAVARRSTRGRRARRDRARPAAREPPRRLHVPRAGRAVRRHGPRASTRDEPVVPRGRRPLRRGARGRARPRPARASSTRRRRPGRAAERCARPRITQPALFTIEYALARLWQSWGVRPARHDRPQRGRVRLRRARGRDVARGRGRGWSPTRGRLMQALPAGRDALGARCRRRAPTPRAARRRWPWPRRTPRAVRGLRADARSRGARSGAGGRRAWCAAPLATSHAFHSPMMDPRGGAVRRARARGRGSQAPRIPFVSTVTGTWITPSRPPTPRTGPATCARPCASRGGVDDASAGAQPRAPRGRTARHAHHDGAAPGEGRVEAAVIASLADTADAGRGVGPARRRRAALDGGRPLDWDASIGEAPARSCSPPTPSSASDSGSTPFPPPAQLAPQPPRCRIAAADAAAVSPPAFPPLPRFRRSHP